MSGGQDEMVCGRGAEKELWLSDKSKIYHGASFFLKGYCSTGHFAVYIVWHNFLVCDVIWPNRTASREILPASPSDGLRVLPGRCDKSWRRHAWIAVAV